MTTAKSKHEFVCSRTYRFFPEVCFDWPKQEATGQALPEGCQASCEAVPDILPATGLIASPVLPLLPLLILQVQPAPHDRPWCCYCRQYWLTETQPCVNCNEVVTVRLADTLLRVSFPCSYSRSSLNLMTSLSAVPVLCAGIQHAVIGITL